MISTNSVTYNTKPIETNDKTYIAFKGWWGQRNGVAIGPVVGNGTAVSVNTTTGLGWMGPPWILVGPCAS